MARSKVCGPVRLGFSAQSCQAVHRGLAHYTLLFSGNRLRILSSATLAAALRILAASSFMLGLGGSFLSTCLHPVGTVALITAINLTAA